MPTDARPATAADASAVQALLARAFQHDPAISHIWPDPAERARRLPAFFALMWAGDMADGGTAYVTANAEAATLWLPSDRPHLTPWALLRQAPTIWRVFGTAARRALAMGALLEAHAPKHPHAYLHFAGCDPAHQGKGHGGRAIRAGLARADATGLPAYLETASPANVPLYAALGFRTVVEYDVPRGPHFWGMERPASAA